MSDENGKTYYDLKTGKLVCPHCNETFDIQLPQNLDFVGRVVKAFDIEHRRCQAKKERRMRCG